MRKDYMPVSEDLASAGETELVEAFWTRVWAGRTPAEAARAALERRDEFGIIDPYLAGLAPGSRVLDGGCGLGEWTVHYAARGLDVVGLDLSAATIARLQRAFPGRTFVVGDVRRTAFEDESFDAYFSWGTFEHFEDGLGACFAEAWRVLRPGGHLFVSVPFQNGRHLRRERRDLARWDEHFRRWRGYERPMRFYQWRLTRPELQREFELAGLDALRIAPIHKADGVHRMVKHDLGLVPGTRANRLARLVLVVLAPKAWVAHMIIGVGRKRGRRAQA
jgi:SAM-dependent methyltransferase